MLSKWTKRRSIILCKEKPIRINARLAKTVQRQLNIILSLFDDHRFDTFQQLSLELHNLFELE